MSQRNRGNFWTLRHENAGAKFRKLRIKTSKENWFQSQEKKQNLKLAQSETKTKKFHQNLNQKQNPKNRLQHSSQTAFSSNYRSGERSHKLESPVAGPKKAGMRKMDQTAIVVDTKNYKRELQHAICSWGNGKLERSGSGWVGAARESLPWSADIVYGFPCLVHMCAHCNSRLGRRSMINFCNELTRMAPIHINCCVECGVEKEKQKKNVKNLATMRWEIVKTWKIWKSEISTPDD